MKNRLGLWLLLAFCATLALVLPASAGAAAWGPEFSISGTPAEELGADNATTLIDDAGNTTYVWDEELSGYRQVLRVYFADGTVGPVQSIPAGSESGQVYDWAAAADGSGTVRVAWVQQQESCTPVCSYAFQVKTVKLGPDGSPSGEPTTIESFPLGEQSIARLRLAVNAGGEAAVLFIRSDNSSSSATLHADRLSAQGAVTPLEVTGTSELNPVDDGIAINAAGEVFTAWGTFDAEYHVIVEAARFPAGATSAEAKNLVGSEHPINVNEIAASIDAEGNGTVVYPGQLGEWGELFAARLESDGSTPGPKAVAPEEAGAFPDFVQRSAAAAPDGSLLVTWASNQRAWIARIEPSGSIGSPLPLTAEGESAWQPVIGRAPDGSGVVLYESRSAPDPSAGGFEWPILKQLPVDAGGNPVAPATEVARVASSERSLETSYDSVAVSASGNAAAGWLEYDYNTEATELRGALRDGVAPVLSLFAPAKALAGEETVLGAAAVDANAVSYAWNFGDGTTGSGPIVGHVFPAGTFTVTLTATDAAGNASSKQATIEVVAAGGGEVVRPETSILKAPPKKSRKRNATLKFISSQAGSRFECALDSGGWKACKSPLKLKKLDVGSHRLKIRAISSSGVVEAEPAVVKFRVLKPKHGHGHSG